MSEKKINMPVELSRFLHCQAPMPGNTLIYSIGSAPDIHVAAGRKDGIFKFSYVHS